MGQAREQLRQAASQAASGEPAAASCGPDPAVETGPPEKKREVCHVGLVFAMGIEAGGLIDQLSGVIRTDGAGFVAREGGLEGRRLVVVESGVGREAAASAAAALVQGHQPRWIITTGFAGGLDDRLRQNDILMANEIVDADGRRLTIDLKFDPQSLHGMRHLHVGRLLTVDQVAADTEEKRALGQQHGALAVDMESMAVADVCRQEQVRCLSIRIISDAVDRALPRDIDYLVKRTTLAGRIGAAAGAALRRPSSIKDMWQLKEDALVASDRLAKFLVGIIGQLP
jgi:adenosylhomocysteine nucleosidase